MTGRDISAGSELLRGATHASEVKFHAGRPKSAWQVAKVIVHLRVMYPDGNFPKRKRLRADLGKRDPSLKSLDWKTLRRAIDRIKT